MFTKVVSVEELRSGLKTQTKSFTRNYSVNAKCVSDTLIFDELKEVVGICNTNISIPNTESEQYKENICVGGSSNGITINGNEVTVYSCQSLGGALSNVTVNVTAIGY